MATRLGSVSEGDDAVSTTAGHSFGKGRRVSKPAGHEHPRDVTGTGPILGVEELHPCAEAPQPRGTVRGVPGPADEATTGLKLEPAAPAQLTSRACSGSMRSKQLAGSDWDSQMGPQTGTFHPRTGTCHGACSAALDASGRRGSGSSFVGLALPSPYPSSKAMGPQGPAQLWPGPSREPMISPGAYLTQTAQGKKMSFENLKIQRFTMKTQPLTCCTDPSSSKWVG